MKLVDLFGSNIIFDTNPIYVGGKPKPFLIRLNNETVYSKLSPLNGETGPLFIEKGGHIPNPEHFNRLVENINKLFNF